MQYPPHNGLTHDQTPDPKNNGTQTPADIVAENAMLRAQLEQARHELADAQAGRETAQTRLRIVLDTLPVAVFIADKKGEIVETNAAARGLWGYTPFVASTTDYDVYKGWRADTGQLLAPEDWSLARTLATGATIINEELIIETFDGLHKTIIHASAPIRDETGEVVGGIVTELDISDRKRAEKALRSSEERYRTLAEAVPQIVWTTDARGRPEYFNQRWYAYTGQSVTQSLVSGTTDAMHPDDFARTLPLWEEALRTATPYDVEYRLRGHDAHYRWFLCRGVPVRNERGDIVAWFGTSTDIDNQKQMEVAQSIVGEASAILAANGDIHAALRQIAQLPLPHFSHWCSLDLYTLSDQPVRIAAYVDLAAGGGLRIEQHDLIQNTQRLDYDATAILDTIPPTLLADFTPGSAHLRQLGAVSVVVVPIRQYEQLLGAITLISISGADDFSDFYRNAIESIARRIAIAIENTRLTQAMEAALRVRDQALIEAEFQRRYFYDLLMTAPAYVLIFRGADHVIEFVNAYEQRLLGNRVLLGSRVADIFHDMGDEPLRHLVAILDRVRETGVAVVGNDVEVQAIWADGASDMPRYFDFVYEPIIAADGTVESILSFSVEVTAQVRARQQAEQQRSYFYNLLMNAPVQIYVIRGSELIADFVNLRAQELFAGRVLTGKSIYETMPELFDQGFLSIMDRVRTTGEPFIGNEVLIWLDLDLDGVREEGYFNFVYQPIREVDNTISGILCVATDVTDQVRARQRVEELAAQLNAIIAAMPDGVYVSDPDGQLTIVNAKGAELLGLAQTNIHGTIDEMRVLLGIADDERADMPINDIPLVRALRGETGNDHIMTIKKADSGQTVYLRTSYAPIYAADDTRTGAVAVSSDITKMRELEQQKDAFLSIAAHELKTPITAIKGLVQMASRRLERAGQMREVETLRNVDRQINRLTALINELTDVSRIQTGKFEMQPLRFDYATQTRRVAEAMQATTTQHTIVVNAPEILEVIGDPDRIEQVLTNLLGNAIKYSPEGGTVTVTLAQEGTDVALRVHDEGIGIPLADRPHLFERFHRASNAKEYRVGGFGLGLYISAQIIQAHNGRIWLCDTETDAHGSTFCVALPAAYSNSHKE